MRAHQGESALNHAGDEFIDEAVFRAPQGGDIEPAGREEIARVGRAAVRRIEQHRALTRLGLEDYERRIKLVADFAHEIQAIGRFGYRGSDRLLFLVIPSIVHGWATKPSHAFGSLVIYRA